MRKVTCTCESTFDADLPDEIDLDAEPERIDQILTGDFFVVACPNCGASLKPELRVRFLSKKRDLDLTVLPELDRLPLYRNKAGLPKGSEALVGYAELFERARVIVDGLDAQVIEIIKYWLLAKAEEKSPEADLRLTYAGIDGDRLVFHAAGLREGEIAVLHIERDLYDRALGDKPRTLRSQPFARIFESSYRSVRVLEADEE
jgi:hypothetical protein